MATETQKHLVAASEKYAESFDKGHLASPPAKKYLIGTLSLSARKQVRLRR